MIFGRRRPRFVESQNGVITDVITPQFVQLSNPGYGRSGQSVIYENQFPFPYSLFFIDDRHPQIIAVKYTPKSRVIITPYSELILE